MGCLSIVNEASHPEVFRDGKKNYYCNNLIIFGRKLQFFTNKCLVFIKNVCSVLSKILVSIVHVEFIFFHNA